MIGEMGERGEDPRAALRGWRAEGSGRRAGGEPEVISGSAKRRELSHHGDIRGIITYMVLNSLEPTRSRHPRSTHSDFWIFILGTA